MTESMTDKLGFEIQTCTRCGGSGRYSYNQIDGSRCYGCGGTGKSYTKRGRVAKLRYEERLCVPAGELKVGDLMQVRELVGFSGGERRYFAPIVEIVPDTLNEGMISISTEHEKYGKNGLICSPKHTVRKGWSAEEKKPLIAEALAYQASLTKAGKPRKTA